MTQAGHAIAVTEPAPHRCPYCGWCPEDSAAPGGDGQELVDYAGNERAWLDWLKSCCNQRACVIRLGAERRRGARQTEATRREMVRPVRARFQQERARRRGLQPKGKR